MKKCIVLFLVIIFISTLYSCSLEGTTSRDSIQLSSEESNEISNTESSNNIDNESKSNSEISIDESKNTSEDSYIVYNPDNYLPFYYSNYFDSEVLYNILRDNKMQIAYKEELENAYGSIYDCIDIIKKYIDIWEDELNISVDLLSDMLDEEDANTLHETIEKWKEESFSMGKIEAIILNNPKYLTYPGSEFAITSNEKLLYLYRDKTYDIKYLTYIFESLQLVDDNDMVSLNFSWDN